MKTLKIASILTVAILTINVSFAQQTKETFKVSGECGMCKSKIEKAAKAAGATYAVWSVEKKTLTVKYNSSSTNTAKIQESIANVGYDTPKFKATEEAYNKLHECCKYDRTARKCCDDANCGKAENCCADKAACKDSECCKGS
jgi:copper chaperone CopZ